VIVVGAGSAGCVLAARLAADPARRVTLVEAGPRDRNPLLRVPLMTGVLLRGRMANWFYHTEPEAALGGRRLFWPRGKVLGGSSAINGMVWTRGLPSDFDGWAQHGLPAWSFERVLQTYRGLESYHGGESAWHGGDGPQPVTQPPGLHPLSTAFLEAGRAAGFPASTDFNGPAPDGFGRYDFTIARGRRVSAATAFLKPLRGAPNLDIVTGAHVLRVVVERGRAVALDIARGRGIERLGAGEIVLCCGTVNSPQVLMLSGIGPADALRTHGIAVAADLPGVGQNLQDHLLVRVEHGCREPVTLHRLLRADRAVVALGRALLTGTGPAARFPLEAGAFLRSDPALDLPDMQSHFLPGLSTAAVRWPWTAAPAQGHGFFANIYRMRPDSRGSIVLRSADPRDAPIIRPNYLSARGDVEALIRGVRLLRRVFAQAPFDRWRGPELQPGPDVHSDAEIEAWIRTRADTVFHPVGTCRMGTDGAAVVDQTLRVHGVTGLRVADASVMPTMPSCNTHAPSMMIGARAAAFIDGERTETPEPIHA
jgi:choline dehydrogenase